MSAEEAMLATLPDEAEELIALPEDIARELAALTEEVDEMKASPIPRSPLVISFEKSSAGCCIICGKRALGWPEIPIGWDFTPAVADADDLRSFLICPECLS